MKYHYSDEQIKKLAMAFYYIDFSQPKAHEVFRCLEKTLEKIMVKNASWREYYFFKLGGSANIKKGEFDNIPPLSDHKEASKTECQ